MDAERSAVPYAFRGQSMNDNWSAYHQVLNRACWSPLACRQCLLLLIVQTLVSENAPITIVIDETLERRWGPQISKRGNFRDSVLSSRKRAVSSSGLRGTRDGGGGDALVDDTTLGSAFLLILSTVPAFSEEAGKRHKTIAMWAGQMISMVHCRLPNREICVVGDGAYNCLELGVHASHRQVALITPCQLDSVLREPPLASNCAAREATLRSWVNTLLGWITSSRIQRRCGRRMTSAGMDKASERYSGAAGPLCGIAVASRPCRFVGFSPAIPGARKNPKPFSARISSIWVFPSCSPSCCAGAWRAHVRKRVLMWASKLNGNGQMWRSNARLHACCAPCVSSPYWEHAWRLPPFMMCWWRYDS